MDSYKVFLSVWRVKQISYEQWINEYKKESARESARERERRSEKATIVKSGH